MATTPARFGPANGIDSKDYLFMMEGPRGVTDAPVNLLGHSLTSPNQNLTDALVYNDVELRNGRIVTVQRTKRAAYETSRTYTIGFPSTLWTPAMQRAIDGGCATTFFLKYLCPDDRIYNHFDVLPEATMNPPIEAEDPITNNDETNILTQTSEIQVPRKVRGWLLGWYIVYDLAASDGLTDIVFMSEDCPGCDSTLGFSFNAVGESATGAEPPSLTTEDRFASVVNRDVGAAIDTDLLMTLNDGNVLVNGQLNNLYTSVDRGVTWTARTIVGTPQAGIRVNNVLVVVGKNGSNNPQIWYSDNLGSSWSTVTSTLLAGTQTLMDVAADESMNTFYTVSTTGKLLVGRIVSGRITLADLTANLPGSPAALSGVAVLGKNIVSVTGATGYVAESLNAGVNWVQLTFPSTSTVKSISGYAYRSVAVAGGGIYVRDLLSDNQYKLYALEDGASVGGTYNRVRVGLEGNFNIFAAVSTSGQVIVGKPFYPNS